MQPNDSGLVRVSVLIAVYNQATYLARAIESILTQTFSSFELILVDDGSTDDSAAIVDAYASRDSRVQVIHQANQGISATLNRGLAASVGQDVARLDGDDIAVPDRLEKQVAFLDAHSSVGMVGGAMTLIDTRDRKHRTEHYFTKPADLRRVAQRASVIPGPSSLTRRQLLVSVGGWRSSLDFSEDYDLTLRIAEKAELANLKDVVTYYRIHPQQATTMHRRRQKGLSELARISARRRQQGLPDPIYPGLQISASTIGSLGLDAADTERLQELFAPAPSA